MRQFLYRIFIIALVGALLQSCASSKKVSNQELQSSEPVLFIPVGVDSAIASNAAILADSSFVEWESEQEAELLKEKGTLLKSESDSLWSALELDQSKKDSTALTDSTAFISSFNQGAQQFIELQRVAAIQEPTTEEQDLYATLVDSATFYFEKALVVNPFDAQTRVILAQLYSIKAGRLNQNEEFEKSIEILEKLSRLEKGDPIILAILAENYFLLNKFSESALNYRKAADLLLETGMLSEKYFLEQQYTDQDSVDLFTYHYYEGQSYLKLFDEFGSKDAFLEAQKYANTEDFKDIVEGELRFIDWDEGNIKASYARDSLIQLVSLGDLQGALVGFESLLMSLRSQRAKDEIEWRAALLNYEMGESEKAAGILFTLYNRIQLQENGFAADTSYQQYLEDYGIITFNIGQDYLNQRRRRLALTYFLQSGQIKWKANARALLRVATLLQNNIEESLKYAILVENELQKLNIDEQKTLYQFLVNQYRRNGNMDLARRYYTLWSQLQ